MVKFWCSKSPLPIAFSESMRASYPTPPSEGWKAVPKEMPIAYGGCVLIFEVTPVMKIKPNPLPSENRVERLTFWLYRRGAIELSVLLPRASLPQSYALATCRGVLVGMGPGLAFTPNRVKHSLCGGLVHNCISPGSTKKKTFFYNLWFKIKTYNFKVY